MFLYQRGIQALFAPSFLRRSISFSLKIPDEQPGFSKASAQWKMPSLIGFSAVAYMVLETSGIKNGLSLTWPHCWRDLSQKIVWSDTPRNQTKLIFLKHAVLKCNIRFGGTAGKSFFNSQTAHWKLSTSTSLEERNIDEGASISKTKCHLEISWKILNIPSGSVSKFGNPEIQKSNLHVASWPLLPLTSRFIL